jgi:hypothetical protein
LEGYNMMNGGDHPSISGACDGHSEEAGDEACSSKKSKSKRKKERRAKAKARK